MILIRLNLISSSKSGGFDPEISIFFILLDALSIRLIRNLLRRCRCGRISFIREAIRVFHLMCEDFGAFLPLYHNIKIIRVGDRIKNVKKYYTPTPPLRGSTNRRFLCQTGGHHFLFDIKGSEAQLVRSSRQILMWDGTCHCPRQRTQFSLKGSGLVKLY